MQVNIREYMSNFAVSIVSVNSLHFLPIYIPEQTGKLDGSAMIILQNIHIFICFLWSTKMFWKSLITNNKILKINQLYESPTYAFG